MSEFYGARSNLKVSQNRADLWFYRTWAVHQATVFTHCPYIVNDISPTQKPFIMRNSGETRFPKSPLTYRAVFLDGETALGAGDHKNIRPRLINVSKAFIMRGGKRPDRKTHVLAVKGSVFAELRRRRRRYVSPNCAQTRKLRLKANYQVSTQKKMGIFKKIWKFPKFEHFTALG